MQPLSFSLAGTHRAIIRGRLALLASALALLLAACGGGGSADQDALCSALPKDTPESLASCVTLDAVHAHIEKLSDIGIASGGSRADGTPGYDASVRYVEGRLRAAGYTVTQRRFTYETFALAAPSVLEQRAPAGGALAHQVFTYSGSGDVTAGVAMANALGCDAADFSGFPAGRIALVRRGTCTFAQKATHAFEAGAAAVVVYNQDDRELGGDLGQEFRPDLPVVHVSKATGDRLAAQVPGGLTLHVQVRAQRTTHTSVNVLAETSAGDPSQVIVAGGHLDSVPGTVGANDNGSGTAALLETALQMAKVPTRYRVRFAFFGAEELGMVGSTAYVASLSAAERARIAAYLNFDMIASPNYVYGIFVGNGQAADGSMLPGTEGRTIQQVFTDFYDRRGLNWRLIDGAEGRSDHTPFSAAGIPYGGLFTGAEDIKTANEAKLWGGTAGQPLDACYHKACDGLDNLSLEALETNAQLVATSVLHFATHGMR